MTNDHNMSSELSLAFAEKEVELARLELILAEGKPEEGKKARDFFHALEKLLGHYWPLPDGQTPYVGLRPDMALLLTQIFHELAEGRIPDPIKLCGVRGRRSAGRTEQHDKAIASTYVSAARQGLIDDSDPIKSVITSYGINLRTAQKWVEGIAPLPIKPRRIVLEMKECGARYQRAGRSESALTQRDDRSEEEIRGRARGR